MKLKKGRVLIADDEPAILSAIKETIEDDYEVVCATNGREALDMMDKHSPDMVLLDISMPEMDGLETFDNIKRQGLGVKIPVVFLTAKGQLADIEKGLGKGAYSYMVKPFLPSHLLEKLDEIFEKLKIREEMKNKKT